MRFVINTHVHPDHLGSNALWSQRGANIIAHDNVSVTLANAAYFDTAISPVTGASAAEMQPIVSYSTDIRLHVNGQTVHVVHPGAAHSNGDSIVYFEEANAVHTGDIYLNTAFPVIDPAGSLDGLIAALEGIASRIDDDTIIIPGHGELSNKAELLAYTGKIREMRDILVGLAEQGLSLEEAVAAKPLARFEEEFDLLIGFLPPELIVAQSYNAILEGR